MIWPPPNDFRDAVRNPATSFSDPDLAASDAVVGANGLPDAHPGNASRVYQLCAEDGRSWAVKCFNRIDDAREARYAAVHAALAGKPYAVGFEYLTEAALIAGRRWPVLKMDWVEGQTLQQVAKERANSPAVMDGLFKRWVQLSRELRTAGVAHGDLQHANVLFVQGKWPGSFTLKLIDYDAMYLPELANSPTYETGNPNFQHPERNERSYSPDLDRFPLLVVATALKALAVRGPDLWRAFAVRDGLLFTAADFRAPGQSRVLRKLWKSPDPTLHALVGKLVLASGQPLAQTPWLDDLCANGAPALTADEERAVDATLKAAATVGTLTLDDDEELIPAEVVAFTLDDESEPVAPKSRPVVEGKPVAAKPLPLPPEPAPARPKPLTPVPVVTDAADEEEDEEPRPRRKPRREPARGFPWVAVAVLLGFMMVAGAIVAGWLVARFEKPVETAQVQPQSNDTPKPQPTPTPTPVPTPAPVLPNPDPAPVPPKPVPPNPAPEPIPERVRPDVAIPPPFMPGPPPFPPGPPNGLPAAPALAVLWKGVAAAPMANQLPQAPLFTADGKTLVLSGGTSGTVLTFDAKTGAAGAVFEGHKGPGGVYWLATAGNDRVVSGGFDAKQTTWDIKTGRPVDAIKFPDLPLLPPGAAGHAGITYGVSPGGRYTVQARRESVRPTLPGPLRVLDTITGKEVLSGDWNGGRVLFTADESRMLVLNGLGKALWYKLPSGEVDGGWEIGAGARADQARVLSMTADGERVLYHGTLAGQPTGVFLLEGRTGRVLRKLNNAAPYQAHFSAVSPDGKHVAVALIDFARNGQWHVDVFETDGWRLVGRASSPDRGGIREVPQFTFTPDGKGLSVLFPTTKELLMFGL